MRLLGNKTWGGGFARFVLDALFPRFCVRCGQEGALLCESCFVTWEPQQPVSGIDQIALFPYADAVTRDLLRAWKFHYDHSAWEILQRKLRPRLHELMALARHREVQVIVPIPLHERRFSERGFDQAALIADFFSQELGMPVVRPLYRVRSTGQQSERTVAERQAEMAQSPFLIIEKPPRSLLLVDDVWTTGSTAKAATEALKRAGTEHVLVGTIARG